MNLSHKNHPKYEPNKWNHNEYIRRSHNCYTYALNLIQPKNANLCHEYIKTTNNYDCPSVRPQPGILSGYIDEFKPHPFSCSKIERRMKKDNPLIKKLRKNQKCPNGYYKIALVTTSKANDYHFYRQDNTGRWSHKDGFKHATNKDAKGRIIKDPELADRGHLDIFCGYYAVPNDQKNKNYSNKTRKSKKYPNKISAYDRMCSDIKKKTKKSKKSKK